MSDTLKLSWVFVIKKIFRNYQNLEKQSFFISAEKFFFFDDHLKKVSHNFFSSSLFNSISLFLHCFAWKFLWAKISFFIPLFNEFPFVFAWHLSISGFSFGLLLNWLDFMFLKKKRKSLVSIFNNFWVSCKFHCLKIKFLMRNETTNRISRLNQSFQQTFSF